jgi:hypothetical protein
MSAARQRSRSSSHGAGRYGSLSSRAEGPAGHRQVDGHDAVGPPADAPQVLVLHARGLVPLLQAAGLVRDADRADRTGRQVAGPGEQLPLDRVGQAAVAPQAGPEELLQVARRDPGVQGRGLGRLARQVRQQPAGVVAKVPGGLRGVKEPLERPQERGPSRADRPDLFRGHGNPSQRAEGTVPAQTAPSPAL